MIRSAGRFLHSWPLTVPLILTLLLSGKLRGQDDAWLHTATAPEAKLTTVLLWPEGAPGALGTAPEDQPRVTIYQPKAATAHTAVVVCPGGSYGMLAKFHEGEDVARWLNGYGITALVLEYRLGPKYHHPVELGDAQRAIRYARAHAAEFGYGPGRIGIWGFSAGGHLASTAGVRFDAGVATSADPVERVSSRPDFLILSYPVISMRDPIAHKGSRENLLGPAADPAKIDELSNELHVTAQTPPAFLFHTSDDGVVPVENSLLFYAALRRAGVPVEMHLYQSGHHGVGLAPNDPVLSDWALRLAAWLRLRGLLTPPQLR